MYICERKRGKKLQRQRYICLTNKLHREAATVKSSTVSVYLPKDKTSRVFWIYCTALIYLCCIHGDEEKGRRRRRRGGGSGRRRRQRMKRTRRRRRRRRRGGGRRRGSSMFHVDRQRKEIATNAWGLRVYRRSKTFRHLSLLFKIVFPATVFRISTTAPSGERFSNARFDNCRVSAVSLRPRTERCVMAFGWRIYGEARKAVFHSAEFPFDVITTRNNGLWII